MRSVLIVASGIYLVLLATITRAAVETFQSDRTLWTQAVIEAPRKVRPMLNLAQAVSADGETDQAVVLYTYALRLSHNPARPRDEQELGDAYAHFNLSLLDRQQRRDVEALTRLRWLHHTHPLFPPAQVWCQRWSC